MRAKGALGIFMQGNFVLANNENMVSLTMARPALFLLSNPLLPIELEIFDHL